MSHIHDKIIELNRKHRQQYHDTDDGCTLQYYSFEFFPPKTEQGMNNLLHRIDRMVDRFSPLFIDVTWGSGGSTFARSLEVASHAQRFSGVDVLMHLTLSGMTKKSLRRALDQAKYSGIRNILALRGEDDRRKLSFSKNFSDSDDEEGNEAFEYAIELVKFIKEEYGDYFGIAVAGHPECHEQSRFSLDEEIAHLKQKVDAGANLIITQLFYDADIFISYVKKCRNAGIKCPILPGIMPIQSYNSFKRMTQYCGVHVPSSLSETLLPIKDDDDAVKEIGCKIAVDLCRKLLKAKVCYGAHFYTLNLERSVSSVLQTLCFANMPITNNPRSAVFLQGKRALPWRQSAIPIRRENELVRPIHWANRPKSYVLRTEGWDEFPNGRWGPSTSPAFGELSDSHFYCFNMGPDEDRMSILGESPSTVQEIYDTFAEYISGNISHLPWCETPLQPESFALQNKLYEINRKGLLTLNSQPAVNGAKNNDSVFGWGPGLNGIVYQKAYVECFVGPDKISQLKEIVEKNNRLNLYAVNACGKEFCIGVEENGVTALTWGVFPNREILQPTIFDPKVFLVWAEEAFLLWVSFTKQFSCQQGLRYSQMWLKMIHPRKQCGKACMT